VETGILDEELRGWARLFAARTRAVSGSIAEIMAIAGRGDLISFAGGLPDPQTFPRDELAEILRELAESGDPRPFQYGPTEGLASTREFLADRLHRIEGLRPAGDELLVTSGGMEALELVSKAFVDHGDGVVVEAPTYLGAIMVFGAFGAEIAAVQVDDDGLEPDALEAELRRGRVPKLLYAIPEHQNPAGVTLSLERRRAVVELARTYGFVIVEDVAYRELGFDEELLPSLWSLAPETVVQIGTFSKTFMPGTRLGWACGPAEIVSRLVWAKQTTDQCASTLAQRLVEEYGRRGLFDEGVRRSREVYRRRWEATSRALEQSMPEGVTWTHPRGGFFTWLTLEEGDTTQLARAAIEHGVAFVPGEPFFPDGRGRTNARLAFSLVPEDAIDEGIARLGRLFTQSQP
jgi:2-aminoadipate transaminase